MFLPSMAISDFIKVLFQLPLNLTCDLVIQFDLQVDFFISYIILCGMSSTLDQNLFLDYFMSYTNMLKVSKYHFCL